MRKVANILPFCRSILEAVSAWDPAQWILSVLGLFSLILFCPLVSGKRNLGSVFGMGIGAALLTAGILLPEIISGIGAIAAHPLGMAILLLVLSAVIVIGIRAAILVAQMVLAAQNRPTGEIDTALVLGCLVGSRALSCRIRAARDYLYAHPSAIALLSGGKGDDEATSEARAMYDALTGAGIDGARLIMEDRSTDTEENIRNCAAILKEMERAGDVVIITHSYHQCRARILAQKAGLSAYAVNARGDLRAYPTYFLRDLLGLAYLSTFGERRKR